MPHVFTLGEFLPRDIAPRVPTNFSTPAAGRAINTPNRKRRREIHRVARLLQLRCWLRTRRLHLQNLLRQPVPHAKQHAHDQA
jgi:hypothetical protein